MFLSWRRPDGFHNSRPEDFKSVDLENNSRVWLHCTEKDWFPFKVSGGWQDEDATKKINNMLNLIESDQSSWNNFLTSDYENSQEDDQAKYFDGLTKWLKELKENRKGDAWEVEIMGEAIDTLYNHVLATKTQLLK